MTSTSGQLSEASTQRHRVAGGRTPAKVLAYQAEYRQRNLQRLRDREKRSYLKHKAERLARNKQWQALNRESVREYQRQYRLANREKAKAEGVAYREAHREKAAATSRAWRIANPTAYATYIAGVRTTSPERLRTYNQKSKAVRKKAKCGDSRPIEQWQAAWRNKKSVKCYWCNKRYSPKQCQSDHVVPLSRGGEHDISNLVVSCRFCNQSKNAKLPEVWNKTLSEPVIFL